MQTIPRPLLVLHDDEVLRDQLRDVARAMRREVLSVGDWDELADLTHQTPASSLLVVDPYFGVDAGGSPSIELSSFLNRFPSLTVIAALPVGRGRLADVLRLGQWGVVQVIDLEEEMTSLALATRLTGARGRPLRGLVEKLLPEKTSPAARAILSASAVIVADGGVGRDLAESFRVTPRTILRWCRRAGLPPPSRLLLWMRILLAAEFLDDPGRPITAVATACGYADERSLRQTLKRFTGMNVTQLREKGAFAAASDAFVAALAEAASPRQRYRPNRRRDSGL